MPRTTRQQARAVASEPDVLTLRYGAAERFIMPIVVVGTIGWIGVYELTLHDAGEATMGVLFLLLTAVIVWLLTFRIVVLVGRDDMVIRNPLRTRVVALDDIVSLTPEYEGLVVRTRNGKKITAIAIQRWNLTLFLRRRSHADDAVDAILARQRHRPSAN